MKKKFSKAVLIFLASVLLISSFELFGKCRQKISREELQNKIISNSKSFPYLENASLPIPFNASKELSRPFYKNIAFQNNQNEAIPQPESLCDNGYYWMGGEAYTADSNENVLVWGAGGNLYFASSSDPIHPLVLPWGDVPFRIKVHNNYAYVFSYLYTYQFDISNPLEPVFYSYGPGLASGYFDFYYSSNDQFLILTDWAFNGGLTIFDLQTMSFKGNYLNNPNGGAYCDLYVDDENNILIAGDYNAGIIDFYDITALACEVPMFIGGIYDNNCGQILYDYPYLYTVYEPWQYYNRFIWGENIDNYCSVSVRFLPNTKNPSSNLFLKEYTSDYDIVSIKDSPNGFVVGYLQNLVVEWAPQFSSMINGYFIDNKTNSYTLDCSYKGSLGVSACRAGGARFFNSSFSEISHFITGEYAYDVLPWGNYLFAPSGKAGVAIIDNVDPSLPRTLSFLETDTSIIPEVRYIAISDNGQHLYLSDGSDKIWIADISNKTSPFIVSYTYYFSTTTSSNIVKILSSQNRLIVASEDGTIDLVDISNPNIFNFLATTSLSSNFSDMEVFTLPMYPTMIFLATTDSINNIQLFDISFSTFVNIGSLNYISGAIAVNENFLYIDQNGTIYPVAIYGSYPSFTLSASGTTPLSVGYSWGPPDLIKKYDDTKLVCAGDNINYGWPSVFLIDIGTDPLAPQLLPYEQPGVLPFDMLSGLSVKDGLIYYATDYFGTGALTLIPDYDMPVVVNSLQVTPVFPDIPSHSPNPIYWLTGDTYLTITVKDNTTAIESVRFKYNNDTITMLTNPTPAGQEGTYSYNWDTTQWNGKVDPARITVEINDSGCNQTVYQSDYTFAVNKIPTFDISWEGGCNEPPSGSECSQNLEWLVCGNLNFTVNAHAYLYNEVPNSTAPNDDIAQIAYKIDNGSWVLYPVFPPYDGAYKNYSQFISFDTTFLSDGFHTLYLRVTDDLGLHTLKDTNQIDSWTFNVFNNGPDPQIVSPPSGNLLRTSSIVVTAHMNNESSIYPTEAVDFYLDSDPGNPLPNGVFLGTSSTNDGNNNFSIIWDATSTPLGYHTLTCWAYYYGCCSAYSRSQAISITLIDSLPEPPPEIAPGNSYSEALVFNEDKQTILWPGEATATGYKLYRGTLNDLPNLQNDNIDSCTRYDGTNTLVDLSSDDPSTAAGNLYWYLVIGYNASGDGPAGNSRIVNSQGICSGGAGNSNPWAGVYSLLPKSMHWSATCAYNGKIYVFGGNEKDGEVNTTYIYDIATDTWTQGANMPTGRYLCTAVEVGGKIYVMGGRQLTASTNPVNVNECYDPATDTWTTKAAMPNAIRGHAAVAANGKIYVMGGNTGAYTDVVSIYDPSSNAWSSGPKLPAKVAYGGAVYSSSKNAIYYVGGVKSSTASSSNFVGKVFALNLSTNSWDAGTAMTYKTAYFGIAANDDGSAIYVVGGMYWNTDDEYPFPGIQVFDTSSSSFQYLNYYPSPLNRAYCNAVFANGSLWVLEGSASRLVDEFNENSGEWYEPIWPINDGTQLIDLTGAVGGGINGKFYVAEGGWSDIPGKVYEYDPDANTWSAKYGVDSTPRMYVSGGVWNDKLVIYGGMDASGGVVGTATLYDPLADTFTAIGGANSRPTLFEASAIYNDKLYLFGGRTDPQNAESLVKYTNILDLNSGTWSQGADLPFAIEQATATAYNGKIYIFSGIDNLDPDYLFEKVLIYDPAANSFTQGATMPFPVYAPNSFEYGGYIYVDSGYNLYYNDLLGGLSGGLMCDMQIYNPSSGTFTMVPRPFGKMRGACGVVGTKYFSTTGEDPNSPVQRLDIMNLN